MSRRGPAEAWTRGMRPAAWGGEGKRVRKRWEGERKREGGRERGTDHELDDGDAKVLVDHRVEADRRAAEEGYEGWVGDVDGELDVILYPSNSRKNK